MVSSAFETLQRIATDYSHDGNLTRRHYRHQRHQSNMAQSTFKTRWPLGDFIAIYNSTTGAAANRARGAEILIPFRTVPVYHKVKFVASKNNSKPDVVDSVHARPEQTDSSGRVIPARFDTVLVHSTGNANKRESFLSQSSI